ncbi:hypothetical protein FDP41_009876 [Naegleria fowleri]|uniref:Threonylcarbamoyl-AMP synthase n=1 Tax=Naegleria fowleri TaxID=5763 RepID=A0A6A5ASY2_NAEFO|nr:uncharacterized protein FDP41_009876 [Naegleria fowleri]KAF0971653.1 hypothetical protein FDP41_009876 [Naegleria fowleri]CAG4709013.1 unnamed protein product [Naegleria fowleri]
MHHSQNLTDSLSSSSLTLSSSLVSSNAPSSSSNKFISFGEQDIHNGCILKVSLNSESSSSGSNLDSYYYEQCSEHLKQGGLVAFPTETVYGLGANALDEKAVYSIFKAKKRPLTDPVIVHVLNVQEAKKYIVIEENSLYMKFYDYLAECFWPGPLTIVSKSNENIIPDCVTASTGYVGLRVPAHPVVRKLLEHCKLPISAPSANRFGHVSPTTASHVMEDLGCYKKEEIDGENVFRILILESSEQDGKHSECSVGIESTVVKITAAEQPNVLKLEVLRRGGISVEQLRKCAQVFVERESKDSYKPEILIETRQKTYSVKMNDTTAQIAPGQLITHYAPYVPAYILENVVTRTESSHSLKENHTLVPIQETIIVDFGGKLQHLSHICLVYKDLSKDGDIHVARKNVFQVLRECEKIESAQAILLPNLLHVDIEHADSLFDRLFRAASGTFACLIEEESGKYSLEIPSRSDAATHPSH